MESSNLTAAFLFAMSSLFCRESFIIKTNWSGKILFLVGLFWGFLIFASYNEILTSVLAYSSPPAPIGSLEEMLESSDHTLVFRKSGSTRKFFETAPENSIGSIFKFNFNKVKVDTLYLHVIL